MTPHRDYDRRVEKLLVSNLFATFKAHSHGAIFLFATEIYFIAWKLLCGGLRKCSDGVNAMHFCVQCVTSHLNRLHTHFVRLQL